MTAKEKPAPPSGPVIDMERSNPSPTAFARAQRSKTVLTGTPNMGTRDGSPGVTVEPDGTLTGVGMELPGSAEE